MLAFRNALVLKGHDFRTCYRAYLLTLSFRAKHNHSLANDYAESRNLRFGTEALKFDAAIGRLRAEQQVSRLRKIVRKRTILLRSK